MHECKYVLLGDPKALQRVRFGKGRVWNPQKQLKLCLSLELQKQHVGDKFCNATEAQILFFMPIPSSFSEKKKRILDGRPHIVKPDNDNLEKLVYDCLKDAGILKDDCIISDTILKKRYSFNPRTEIILKEIIWKDKI